MKTKTKLPRASVKYIAQGYDIEDEIYMYSRNTAYNANAGRRWTQPVAVIPCATAKEAKALVRVANMTHDELIKLISKATLESFMDDSHEWAKEPKAVIRALHLPTRTAP